MICLISRLILALTLSVTLLSAAPSTDPLINAAEEATYFLFNESYQELVNAEKKNPNPSRESSYLRAIILINVQPKTDSNMEQALELFEKVRSENKDDDLGVSARYYQARIYQIHLTEPNIEKAESIYRELIEKHPQHPLSQQAIVKLAASRIYNSPNLEVVSQRIQEADKFAALISSPSASSAYHYIMGDAIIRFKKDSLPQALDHLIKSNEKGIKRIQQRADTYIRIAEIARELKSNSVALDYYNRFLNEFPRDIRTHMVKQTVATLTASSSTKTGKKS